MSVILYSKREIVAALTANWGRGSIGSLSNQRYMDYLAKFGTELAAANANAYRATYSDDSVDDIVITRSDVKYALVRDSFEQKQQGMRALRGFRYNLTANNGQDFATLDILEGLLDLWRAAYECSVATHA